jgi:hypothetical protein
VPAHKVSLEVRFWAKVEQTDGCWLWTAARSGDGYGHIKIDGRMMKAHRVAYEMAHGTIPEGLDVDHLCRQPLCVRPEHLEPVSRRTNILRGIGYTAQQAAKTHCKHGHPFSDENTYITPSGSRQCRRCNRAAVDRYQRR